MQNKEHDTRTIKEQVNPTSPIYYIERGRLAHLLNWCHLLCFGSTLSLTRIVLVILLVCKQLWQESLWTFVDTAKQSWCYVLKYSKILCLETLPNNLAVSVSLSLGLT